MRAMVYVLVFAILAGITYGELTIIGLQFSTRLLVATLMGSAIVKAILIALFFQHLKDEPRSLASLLILGLIAVSVLSIITLLQQEHLLH